MDERVKFVRDRKTRLFDIECHLRQYGMKDEKVEEILSTIYDLELSSYKMGYMGASEDLMAVDTL